MRIGICDDSPEDSRTLKRILSEIRQGDGADEIISFQRSGDLLKAIEDEPPFSCLFLDILMPDLNGMRLASLIRERYPDAQTQIVFTTTSRDYALEAFAYRAVHYLVKPIRREDVQEALNRVSKELPRQMGLTIKTGQTWRFIKLDQIAVCESRNHNTCISLFNGETILCSITMKDLKSKLGKGFVQIARGITANFNFISVIERRACILKDGRRILFSRGNLEEIHGTLDNLVFSQLTEGNML